MEKTKRLKLVIELSLGCYPGENGKDLENFVKGSDRAGEFQGLQDELQKFLYSDLDDYERLRELYEKYNKLKAELTKAFYDQRPRSPYLIDRNPGTDRVWMGIPKTKEVR